MKSRLLFVPMILAAFVVGCTETSVDPIIAAPSLGESTITFKAFVKNVGVSEIEGPLEISGTAAYHFTPLTESEGQPLVTPMQQLSMRVNASVNRYETTSCVGEVCCEGCQPLNFREQPSYKLTREYTLPAVGSDVKLVIEFVATRGDVSFSHAWIEHAE